MNNFIPSEYQKIGLLTYKLRVNGSPNARCVGKDKNGKFLFENINTDQLDYLFNDNEIEGILSDLKNDAKDSKLKYVA